MSESVPASPAIPEFSGRHVLNTTDQVQLLIAKHGAEELLQEAAAEFKHLLFHRVKFYPEFTTCDGAKWYALRMNHDGADYLFLVSKDTHGAEPILGLHHDDSADISEQTLAKVDQTIYSVLKMADFEIGSREAK